MILAFLLTCAPEPDSGIPYECDCERRYTVEVDCVDGVGHATVPDGLQVLTATWYGYAADGSPASASTTWDGLGEQVEAACPGPGVVWVRLVDVP